MLRLCFISLILLGSLFANEAETTVDTLLHDKIKNLIGEPIYNEHINLINFVFKNKHNYQHNESLNYISIIKTLKENGLLHLNYEEPKDILIQFKINNNPLKSLKILKDTLKIIGLLLLFY